MIFSNNGLVFFTSGKGIVKINYLFMIVSPISASIMYLRHRQAQLNIGLCKLLGVIKKAIVKTAFFCAPHWRIIEPI